MRSRSSTCKDSCGSDACRQRDSGFPGPVPGPVTFWARNGPWARWCPEGTGTVLPAHPSLDVPGTVLGLCTCVGWLLFALQRHCLPLEASECAFGIKLTFKNRTVPTRSISGKELRWKAEPGCHNWCLSVSFVCVPLDYWKVAFCPLSAGVREVPALAWAP